MWRILLGKMEKQNLINYSFVTIEYERTSICSWQKDFSSLWIIKNKEKIKQVKLIIQTKLIIYIAIVYNVLLYEVFNHSFTIEKCLNKLETFGFFIYAWQQN